MRSDARAKRQAILDAAWRLIAEKGTYLPMRAVAAEAEVGIATLYRHFPTPEDLVIGVIDEVSGRMTGILERHADVPVGTPEQEEEAWRALVREIAALGPGALIYQIAPAAQTSTTLQQHIEPRREVMVEVVRGMITRAEAVGAVRAGLRPERLLVGLAAITRPYPHYVDENLPDQRDWMVEVYLDGLRPPRD